MNITMVNFVVKITSVLITTVDSGNNVSTEIFVTSFRTVYQSSFVAMVRQKRHQYFILHVFPISFTH